MKLLDKPLTQKVIDNILDMVKGNIARICVSDTNEEIISSLGFAIDRLSLIAYSRIKAKTEELHLLKAEVEELRNFKAQAVNRIVFPKRY